MKDLHLKEEKRKESEIMRPYRDALNFFWKYLALAGIIYFLCIPIAAFLERHVPPNILGLIIIFAPFIPWYFLLVRLLKRYIVFYTEMAEIRAEVKTPYSDGEKEKNLKELAK